MTKHELYAELVRKRKQCALCNGLTNPATVTGGSCDSDEIGPWSRWQANLNGRVLVVGQDWGDVAYFKKWDGRDQEQGNPTNENLQKLLAVLNIGISQPLEKQISSVFLTNMVLCLKRGGMQAAVRDEWLCNCTREFLVPLINIVRPRIVLALGLSVTKSILDYYDIPHRSTAKLADLMARGPYSLTREIHFLPVYHCGAGSVNRNRSLVEQTEDWQRIAAWLTMNAAVAVKA
jgi:uracil-DNA glycosylase family 4